MYWSRATFARMDAAAMDEYVLSPCSTVTCETREPFIA